MHYCDAKSIIQIYEGLCYAMQKVLFKSAKTYAIAMQKVSLEGLCCLYVINIIWICKCLCYCNLKSIIGLYCFNKNVSLKSIKTNAAAMQKALLKSARACTIVM